MNDNNDLVIKNDQPPTELSIFTAKEIVLDGISYKPVHTSEGLKVPILVEQPHKTKCVYFLIPKEEIIKCLKEYLSELIDPSVLKHTDS